MNNLNRPRTLAARLFAAALLLVSAASALAAVHYVDVNSTNATPPFTSWATAATNIQEAVDVAVAGDEIVVTNGIYATGGRAGNRVAVDKPLNVRSVNGPQFTAINGAGAVRCVYFSSGGSLSGFTLTNGFGYVAGGGVRCVFQTAVVSNCVLTGNRAYPSDFIETYGGGATGATLNNCTLSGNSADNGGAADICTLNNCTLTGNSASYGGGASDSILNNCTLTGNSALGAFGYGGGAYGGTLNNCTLTGNSASELGGGTYYSTLNNCIVYFNTAPQGANYNSVAFYSSTLNYCCTTPQPTNGVGNITNAPLVVDLAGGNLRLQPDSPCVNAGNNTFVLTATDLDGNPRIVGGTVDIGAYEYQSLDLLSFGVVSNRFGFNATGQSNWVIVLEVSSNFTNWTPLTTNSLNGSPFPFYDPTPPSLPQRFYRARME